MDLATILVVLVSQLVIFVLFVWVLRYSNRRTIKELAALENKVNHLNQSFSKLERFFQDVRKRQQPESEQTPAVSDSLQSSSKPESIAVLAKQSGSKK